MKALIFFLVLLNIGYGGWQLIFGSDEAANTQGVSKISLEYQDVPELQLVPQPTETLYEEAVPEVEQAVEETVAADATVEEPVEELVVAENPAEAQCWLLGPFDAKDGAQHLRTRLQSNGVAMDINKLATPIAPDYWVYVEPQVSRRAAVQLLRELQARKIDSFIVSEGDLQNAISLGIFSKEESARRVLAKHQGQDYPVAMTTIPRQIEEFWGVLPASEYEKITEERWSTLQDQGSGFTMKQNFCDVVASTNILE